MSAFEQSLGFALELPLLYKLGSIALLLLLIHSFLLIERPVSGLPIVKADANGWKGFLPAAFHWLTDASDIVRKGLRENKSCFQVVTGSGYRVVVPNRFADELRNNADLNFPEAFAPDLFVDYPGFEGNRAGLKDETFIQDVVRVKLTQSLGLVTDDLTDEAAAAMSDNFGDCPDWTTFEIRERLVDIIARLTSRVFLGDRLCRDKEWIRIAKEYTIDTVMAGKLLRLHPAVIRPVVHWFLPACRRLRSEVRDARRLINPEVEQRRKLAEKALQAGEKVQKKADAIGWMVEVAKGREVDYVGAQLSLTQAAVHTTSESTIQCVRQLCLNPEAVQILREEVQTVLNQHGWSRVSLPKMILMDSFLKEVQRTDGITFLSMQRMVKKDVLLSDGTVLPKGSRIMVVDDANTDAEIFPEPQKFDFRRYQRMREQPGHENRHQFVTTTRDNMGFGHGKHACPGRFFASNEMKIFLGSLLLKYDIRSVPGSAQPDFKPFEIGKMVDPKFRVQLRRRS